MAIYTSEYQAECWRKGCLAMVEGWCNSPEFVERLGKAWQVLMDSEAFGSYPGFYGKGYAYLMDKPLKAVSIPTAIGMGTAAVIIKNPVVSRRFLPWGN